MRAQTKAERVAVKSNKKADRQAAKARERAENKQSAARAKAKSAEVLAAAATARAADLGSTPQLPVPPVPRRNRVSSASQELPLPQRAGRALRLSSPPSLQAARSADFLPSPDAASPDVVVPFPFHSGPERLASAAPSYPSKSPGPPPPPAPPEVGLAGPAWGTGEEHRKQQLKNEYARVERDHWEKRERGGVR